MNSTLGILLSRRRSHIFSTTSYCTAFHFAYDANFNSFELDKRFDNMDWTSADLAAFNIVVQDQDQDTFFDGPLPDYPGFPGFIEKEEIVSPRFIQLIKRVRKDMDASPIEAEPSFDAFLGSLLTFMQYCDAHSSAIGGRKIRMIVRNEFAVTIANVGVAHRPRLTVLILQHNKSAIKVSDPEAHLIATAIGAFQENKKVKFTTELEEKVVLGITTAEQIIPTFHKIKVTSELERVGEKPVTQTVVWRHKARVPKPYDDIMTLENRRRILLSASRFLLPYYVGSRDVDDILLLGSMGLLLVRLTATVLASTYPHAHGNT